MAITQLVNAEVPLAIFCLIFAITVVVWKTIGELSFIIPGWDDIFGSSGDLYQRRDVNEEFWGVYYFCLYGIGGITGQLSGYLLSTDIKNRGRTPDSTKAIVCARLFGLFHISIGLHHLAWSLSRKWGRLDLDGLGLVGGGYFPYTIQSSMTSYHGLMLLLTTRQTDFSQIARRKTLLDTCSLMSLMELLFFLPQTWMDYRDESLERFAWNLSILSPVMVLVADVYSERNVIDQVAKSK